MNKGKKTAKTRLLSAIALTLGLAAARASAEAAPADSARTAKQPEVRLMRLPGFEAPVPVRVAAEAPAAAVPAAEDPCADVSDRVDFLEAPILDLKARYWAAKLKEGVSIEELKERPGVHLNDPDLRRRFVQKVKAYASQDGPVMLSPDETARFLKADQKARRLERACGTGDFRPAGRQANALTAQEKGGS